MMTADGEPVSLTTAAELLVAALEGTAPCSPCARMVITSPSI
jgi:hypothetical protein